MTTIICLRSVVIYNFIKTDYMIRNADQTRKTMLFVCTIRSYLMFILIAISHDIWEVISTLGKITTTKTKLINQARNLDFSRVSSHLIARATYDVWLYPFWEFMSSRVLPLLLEVRRKVSFVFTYNQFLSVTHVHLFSFGILSLLLSVFYFFGFVRFLSFSCTSVYFWIVNYTYVFLSSIIVSVMFSLRS